MTTTTSAPVSSGSSGRSAARAAATTAGGPSGRTASGVVPSSAARTSAGERSAAGTRARCLDTREQPTSAPELRSSRDHRRVPGAAACPLPRHRRPRRAARAGARGLGRVLPFWDYDVAESRRWWAAAVEAAVEGWPASVRSSVPVNVTVPAVDADRAHAIVVASGCGTAKVKVAEPGQSEADELARVEAVRDALGPAGAIRVDANAAWDVDTAVSRIAGLDRRVGLEYVEQPCATLEELIALRRRIDVRIAADEVVRRSADPLRVDLREACDVVVLKVQPLGGVRAALRVAEAHGLPCVVSSALESSVGIAAGVALAAALPELPFACGLATVALFTDDVTSSPLLPVGGELPVVRPEPDRLAAVAADPDTDARWRARLEAVTAA
ncbi:o-succinylbenzoate synthase [Blastococcus brunescens]|uniref:O-succinylbenzoate synthase n=1 Tax=Blastococcus brunescens TaxID=1564165 RepID=A0ABZ1AZ04_9ACTN|nr:o-succinylbenzoate synthase [Blastococcus sp. BMG 8361]WRL63156.1 o-succinylbenzoate synthase [Blastococcus sp. BMG 8361]